MLFAAAHPERTVALDPPGCRGARANRRGLAVGREHRGGVRGGDGDVAGALGEGTWDSAPSPRASGTWSGDERGGTRADAREHTQLAPRRSCAWRSTSTCVMSLPAINVPTLIVHAVDDQVCHVENARFLARTIPGARYVELPGADHVPWFDPDATVAEIREFLTGTREARTAGPGARDGALHRPRRLDRACGGARRSALARPPRAAPRSGAARARRGSTGTRSTPPATGSSRPSTVRRAAIRCAQAIVDGGAAARARGPRGPAHRRGRARGRQGRGHRRQHRRPRRGDRPARGEVLVSGTVKDLVAGSGLEFEDRGVATLKGVPGEWQLFAVVG